MTKTLLVNEKSVNFESDLDCRPYYRILDGTLPNTIMLERPHIIDVLRKLQKCPKCGNPVWDIIYGAGDMTELEFLLEYHKSAIMGGDTIPRRPPIWACSCGCKRFRKVLPDGTDAPVKVKLLKNVRRAPASRIGWEE